MERPRKEYDMSVMEKVGKIKDDAINLNQSIKPSDMVSTEIRIREGSDHDEDTFSIDGVEIIIQQLTFIQLRKAEREGYKTLDDTDLGKKLNLVNRTEANLDVDLGKLTWKESLAIEEINDIQDLWLAYFTLVEGKHPRISGDTKKDLHYVEHLKPSEIEELIKRIRFVNGLPKSWKDVDDATPSGEDVLRGFHDDQQSGGVKVGDGENELQPDTTSPNDTPAKVHTELEL
jgi:hypothetical protein